MPLYEYECKQCRKHLEKIQSFSAAPETVCPSCGGRLERVISAPAFQFKGAGWYVTDYAKSASSNASGSGDRADKKAPTKAENQPEGTSAVKPSTDAAPAASAAETASSNTTNTTAAAPAASSV